MLALQALESSPNCSVLTNDSSLWTEACGASDLSQLGAIFVWAGYMVLMICAHFHPIFPGNSPVGCRGFWVLDAKGNAGRLRLQGEGFGVCAMRGQGLSTVAVGSDETWCSWCQEVPFVAGIVDQFEGTEAV